MMPLEGMSYGEQAALYRRCCAEIRGGKPMLFKRSFLQVKDEQGISVAFEPRPNQAYYDREIWGSIKDWWQPLQVFLLKDRKALWSTDDQLNTSAGMFCMPGFHALHVADSDDTFRAANQAFDLHWEGLPEWLRDQMRKKHWDTEFKEVDWGSGVTSSVTMSSSRSPNFGRGQTPKKVSYDEMAHYNPAFEQRLYASIANSLPQGAHVFKASTPNGKKNQFYYDFQEIKNGEKTAIYIARYWFQNPLNALPRGHLLARPFDKGDITPGNAGGQVGEADELFLVERYGLSSDQLRWRRAEIHKSVGICRGDKGVGYALFKQEHAENDVDCWTNLGNPQFDGMILAYLAKEARPPFETRTMTGGLRWNLWERPMPGHVYTAGMDFATGRAEGGDATTMQVFDATTLTYVAELYGQHTSVYNALGAAMEMCRLYNNALYVPEINTVGTTATDDARLKHEYRNLYYNRAKVADGKRPEYGWKATESTVLKLWADFQGHLDHGLLKVPNGDLSRDIADYDPNTDTHWPDRMRAAAIALEAALEWGLLGKGARETTGTALETAGVTYYPPTRGEYIRG